MKKFVKVLAFVVAVMMTVTCFVSCNKNEDKSDELYIGVSGPLTGGAAVYGIAVKNSAQLAVDEINAKGGVNGYKLKFVMMDDAHDSRKVEANYTKMLEDGMKLALGCVTTAPAKEFKRLSKEDNLFFITPSASANEIVEFPNAYQMCFADGNQGSVAAQYVNENFKGKTIGMLYRSDDPYSSGIVDQFKATVDSSVNVVETSFTGENVASFSSQINTLKDCNFVFMPIYCTPAAQFMTEAKDIMPANAVYYGCDGLDGIETAVEGFNINSIPQEVSFLSHFNSKATSGAAGEFIEKYKAKYGTDTLNQFGASAYDCIYALAGALEQCKDITPDSSVTDICEALKKVFNGGYTFSGVTGENIKWESTGYVNKKAIKYVVKEASGAAN